MSVLMIPEDRAPWPSLGGAVCDWIESHLVFGPGDLRGQPAAIDAEKRALIWRMYEVYPKGHEQAGRRRFKRCAISLRKGTAKTELAAWIAAAELHPAAPVRCIGWEKVGKAWEPVGGGVTDPYIPLVAYTEEQTEDLAYAALRTILEFSDVAGDFDIGLERIMRVAGDGKAVALPSAPDGRDGARTTFQHFDETHRFTLPRLVTAHKTMMANIPKRKLADAWSLETTTAPEPGSGSVAEATMEYARHVKDGRAKDSRLFFFHREASDGHDLTTPEGVRAAVVEASGPSAEWSDLETIIEQWRDPTADLAYLERVWLNRIVKGASQAFDVKRWESLKAANPVRPRRLITLGFDGGVFDDSTALVATDIEAGFQWVPGVWERPLTLKKDDEWQVPAVEVDAVVRRLFEEFQVWRLYADPPHWQSWIAQWTATFDPEGTPREKKRVHEWPTYRRRQMSAALENFDTAIKTGTISHDGDPRLQRHIGNSRKRYLDGERDDQGRKCWLIQKERPDSPHKIDLAMAAVLSWEARTDAIAAGATDGESIYETRGLATI